MIIDQPLTHDGSIWTYEEYPRYKTQIEIARERLQRYHSEGTYQDINEKELQEYFDKKGFHENWPQPWRWIALLAIVAGIIVYKLITG